MEISNQNENKQKPLSAGREVSDEYTQNSKVKTSATTNDIPTFGWSSYAERVNGRFAMIGFTAILLIELISKNNFFEWAGLM